MKWYGSINNRIDERRPSKVPEVGMGVTEYLWSDRHAYEIVEVENEKHFKMREYDVKNIGAGFGDNSWELISNPNGYVYDMVYRYGAWYERKTYTKDLVEKIIEEQGYILVNPDIVKKAKEKGIAYQYSKMNIVIGHANYYYDFEF